MFFQGRALWHCSIALWSLYTGQPAPTDSWGLGCRHVVMGLAHEVLDGVGDPDLEVVEYGESACHYRRCMTDDEGSSVPRKQSAYTLPGGMGDR